MLSLGRLRRGRGVVLVVFCTVRILRRAVYGMGCAVGLSLFSFALLDFLSGRLFIRGYPTYVQRTLSSGPICYKKKP